MLIGEGQSREVAKGEILCKHAENLVRDAGEGHGGRSGGERGDAMVSKHATGAQRLSVLKCMKPTGIPVFYLQPLKVSPRSEYHFFGTFPH